MPLSAALRAKQYQTAIHDLLSPNRQAREGELMGKLLLLVGVVVAAAVTIGINRIVVTDGRIAAVALHAPVDAQIAAFKSDYLPLERQARA
jgi:hypothetical protein